MSSPSHPSGTPPPLPGQKPRTNGNETTGTHGQVNSNPGWLRKWFWAPINPGENWAQTIFRVVGNLFRTSFSILVLIILGTTATLWVDQVQRDQQQERVVQQQSQAEATEFIIIKEPHTEAMRKIAERGIAPIETAAIGGDPEAQYLFGLALVLGIDVAADEQSGIEWFQKSAAQKHPSGLNALGNTLFYGLGVDENRDDGLTLFQEANRLGNSSARANLAEVYLNGDAVPKDVDRGLEMMRSAADDGNTYAQRYLGNIYRNGEYGIQRDFQQAERWFLLAAEQGEPESQRLLGFLYGNDEFDKYSVEQSFQWMLRAAKQGDAIGQAALADRYRIGRGTPSDQYRWLKWMTLSAEQGLPFAQSELGEYYFRENRYRDAERWYRQAADAGNANGRLGLGRMYREGRVVAQDYSIAVELFQLAAQEGQATAQLYLAEMFHDGEGVTKNQTRAYMWANVAAAKGVPRARILRDEIQRIELTAAQLSRAQQMARDCIATEYKDC